MSAESGDLKHNTQGQDETRQLRKRAEDLISRQGSQGTNPSGDLNLKRLVYELEVHQIELEIQNEELRQARNAVEAGLERYADLYDFAPIGYFTLDQVGIVKQSNLHGARLLNMERANLVGRHFGHFIAEGDRPAFNSFLEQVFEDYLKQSCELRLRQESNELFWIQIEAIASNDRLECRTIVMDIQARKQAEMKLEHMSMHDALTGLYNRGYFVESMERLGHGRHFPVSILMADVDHLKITNDQKGHAAGDEILKRVAQVLTAAFRNEDVIARIGGDEFAVLLPNTTATAANDIQERLHDILGEHNTNYFTENPLKLSTGISTTEFGSTLAQALQEADAAMYKQKGG